MSTKLTALPYAQNGAALRDGIVRAIEPGVKRVGGCDRFTFASGSDAQSD
jgi:hypothetical protein